MEIIDIHAHIYPRVAGITKGAPMVSMRHGKVKIGNQITQFLPPSFTEVASTPETLIAYMDWCGISKALLMPNPYYGYHNDYVLEAVRAYPDRLKGIALVDLLRGEEAARELERIYEETELFGFKVETDSTFQCAPHKHMTDADLMPVWECCNRYRQPVFLHLFTDRDVEDLETLTRRFSQITYVICHMGADSCFLPGRDRGNFQRVLRLAKENSNVYLDTSTVPVYFQEEYPFPTSVKIIQEAYQAVGAEKLLWSSDYPGMLNHATMRELIDMVVRHSKIPRKDLGKIMGENAKKLWFSD